MNRTEICGNIASGKTTFASNFYADSFNVIFENFKLNPFYIPFYQNPQKYSFETEVTFLFQHYHSIKATQHSNLVCDYSIIQDMAYADLNLEGNRHKIFFDIINELLLEIGNPTKIIYLICPEEVLLERIKLRKREAEKSISIEYLKSLAGAIQKRIELVSEDVEIIEIDSDVYDFRRGEDLIKIKNLL